MSPGPLQVAPVFLLGVGISSGQGVQVFSVMKYVVAVRIFRFLRDCIFVSLADKQAQAKKDLLPDHLAVCNQLMSIYTFHGWYICLYSTDIALIAQSNSFNHIFIQRLILR